MRSSRGLVLFALLTLSCASHPVDYAAQRTACSYGPGQKAAATLGDYPTGHNIPVDHIILVMQENRTFDSYFSSLTVPGQTVDGAAADASNPDPTASPSPGATISRFHQTSYCFDNPAEEWDQVHREIDGGKLDGFTAQNALTDPVNDPTGRRAMGYFDESDLPFYYALARAFAVSDRHFASVQANTWPNRMYYFAGTSWGVTADTFPPMSGADGPLPNLFTRLNDANVSWTVYAQDVPTIAILSATWTNNLSHVASYDQFFTDAKAGLLPSVVIVEGSDMYGGASPDEDPPADMQVGQKMVADIVAAVTTAPSWPRSALFISYDEPGGLYDHVPPPSACVPDDIAPVVPAGGVTGAFDQLGLRVPLMIVSPYAKRGYVSHQVTDHTSLLRFVEARFDLQALTKRDANAVPPFDAFDFHHADLTVPSLPPAAIDATQASTCASKYPPAMNE